jgi:hypothetical protein
MQVLAIVGPVDSSFSLNAFGRVVGATMLGVGTIFQPKARIDDHWSTSPKVVLVGEVAADASGDPPRPDA